MVESSIDFERLYTDDEYLDEIFKVKCSALWKLQRQFEAKQEIAMDDLDDSRSSAYSSVSLVQRLFSKPDHLNLSKGPIKKLKETVDDHESRIENSLSILCRVKCLIVLKMIFFLCIFQPCIALISFVRWMGVIEIVFFSVIIRVVAVHTPKLNQDYSIIITGSLHSFLIVIAVLYFLEWLLNSDGYPIILQTFEKVKENWRAFSNVSGAEMKASEKK